MEFLRRTWAYIRLNLGEVSAERKIIFGSLLIILLLGLMLVLLLYPGRSPYEPISQFASDRQGEVVARLNAAGIKVRQENGQLLVPRDRQLLALTVLERGDLLSSNTAVAWDDMIRRRSPWMSNRQSEQDWLLAKQQVLGETIRTMKGVRSATVIVDLPQQKGFGRTSLRPSAAVNVVTESNDRISQHLTEAIAGLVSSAIAGMTPQDVVVIDANHGKQYTTKTEDDLGPEDNLPMVYALEQYHQSKIANLLSYIPGVIVAVNVQVEPIRKWEERDYAYQPTEPLKSAFERETERRDVDPAGEPGVRSNNGLDIQSGVRTGSTETSTESRNEFGEQKIVKESYKKHVGQTTKQINVTVNVPRSYFVYRFQQGQPRPAAEEPQKTAPAEPTPQFISEQLALIESQVEPQIITEQSKGMVRVHMIPDAGELTAIVNPVPAVSGVNALLNARWLKPAGLTLLSLLSLAIMFGMVRRATHQPPMPSIEDLAGVPPVLPSDEELIGEAEESETAMAGVEVNEDEIRSRKIAEQISELVKANPAEAARLVKRWVGVED